MTRSIDFDYDLWANKKWLTYCQNHPKDQYQETLLHMLQAQWIWLRRIILSQKIEVTLPEKPEIATESAFELLSSTFLQVDLLVPSETVIDYTNLAGERFSNTYSEIRQHVLNHGTYHRGQLRGLVPNPQDGEFPDTDFILMIRRQAN